MFDCPEPTQTSPTSTSSRVSVLVPATVSVSGPPALSGSSLTSHLPCASACRFLLVAELDRHLFARRGGAPDRHGHVALQTMWLLITGGSFTSPAATVAMDTEQ